MTDSAPDPSVLADDELRDRIRASRREEARVSFERRVLHGKIDVVRSEVRARLERRRGAAAGPEGDALEALLGRLTDVLTHTGPPPIEAELAELGAEPGPPPATDGEDLPDLSTVSDEELTSLVRALMRREREVSDRRNALHRDIDGLRAEHVVRVQRRYADQAEGG